MTRATVARAVVALCVLLVSTFIALSTPPRLGLDLRGGTRLVVEARDTADVKVDRGVTDRTLEVLRNRVDALGVAEPVLTRSGENRIIVELPDVQDPREAAEVLGRTAQLTFHPVLGPADDVPQGESPPGDSPRGGKVLEDEQGRPLELGRAALTGAEVKDAEALLDTQGSAGWFVSLDFRGSGKGWAKLTGEAACHPPGDDRRRVAIVLDDEVVSSPGVDAEVRCGAGITGGATRITGSFDQQEARQLALLVKGGALPVPVEVVEQRTVGPTLGAAAIDASARAALLGTLLTALFVVAVYRFFGALAALALVAYGLISYAALVGLGVTLTLPGLAGFVLAIGMAVDANVLVFERAREEYQAAPPRRRSLRAALAAGFRNARSAIADSNVTTLLAAGLLFFFASGPVRGFGVTLAVGVLASMVSALVVARALAELCAGSRFLAARPRLNGVTLTGRLRERLLRWSPNLLRHPRRLLALSALVVVVAGAGVGLRGLELGVEFTGGRLTEYSTSRPVDVDTARRALADAGFANAEVNSSGDADISVRAPKLTDEEESRVRAALAEEGGEVTRVSDEMIGPSLGSELRKNALIALGVAVAGQLLYLAVRFRWSFAAGAVTAMVHDVVVLVGVFAWLGKPVDGVFLAALLTVIGYSVNDSVVVFDRVRELWGAARRKPLAPLANTAVLQTMPRTINTGMGATFILAALALLGGDTLADFALALLIGITVGSYSSIFTAVPLALRLEQRHGRPAPEPRRPKRTAPTLGGRAPVDNGARV
ncbi:protein translocase subunit SecD [Streptomyces sp. OF3]|uniref:Multifunctional fusion protein n=1 Tax=Streptomyces alkaliterrae TaxID=2213162 RepID=A0A7W3WMT5_9ACTN|nr:protein translocase subunit SecD [Streptomyces alkaliterrae]MBB1255272.1 protein translocase subunit SecD [Streptomyces alkaliterrae]